MAATKELHQSSPARLSTFLATCAQAQGGQLPHAHVSNKGKQVPRANLGAPLPLASEVRLTETVCPPVPSRSPSVPGYAASFDSLSMAPSSAVTGVPGASRRRERRPVRRGGMCKRGRSCTGTHVIITSHNVNKLTNRKLQSALDVAGEVDAEAPVVLCL